MLVNVRPTVVWFLSFFVNLLGGCIRCVHNDRLFVETVLSLHIPCLAFEAHVVDLTHAHHA